MKNSGYTLVETLLTLGIIGIITALLLPAVKNMRPDERKISYLKVHDAVVTAVKELASDSRLFPPCQTMGSQTACFSNHTLFNNVMSNEPNNAKFCILLAEKFGELNPTCSNIYAVFNNANRSFSFTTKTGEQFYVTTERKAPQNAADPLSWRSQVVFDVNGDKAPNCIYDDNNASACPNPDTFMLWVMADGNVIAGDGVGDFYLSSRNETRKRNINVTKTAASIVTTINSNHLQNVEAKQY